MTILVSSKDGSELKIGDVVKSFRGEKYVLEGFYAKGCSSGRVILRKPGSDRKEEYFPAVIGAAIVEEDAA